MINRNYTRLWVGQATSLVGDLTFDTAVVLWIGTVLLSGKSYAPAVSSSMLLVVAVVSILAGPIAGVYADRWNKRQTMLRADLARAGLIGLLTVLSILPSPVFPISVMIAAIGVILALSTLAAQFFAPARFVLISEIVPAADQTRAAALAQATSAVAIIVGPPMGALLLLSVGVQWALALNAASFALSYLVIRSVRVPEPAAAEPVRVGEPTGVGVEFRAGLAVVLGNRVIRAMLIAAFLAMLGTGAINALDLYFVLENLKVNAGWFGTLEALFGGGILIGAWIGHRFAVRLSSERVFCAALLGYGAAVIGYSRTASLAVAIVLTVIFGVCLGALNTVAFPIILSSVPQRFLGRVMAVFNPANKLASLLSIGLSSLLVSTVLQDFRCSIAGVRFGRIDSVFGASGLLILAGGVYATIALRARQCQPADSCEAQVPLAMS